MLELSSIAIDPALANKGAWFEYMGGRFLVARQGQAHQEVLGLLYSQNADIANAKDAEGKPTVEASAKLIEIYQQAFAQSCLLDWDGITENGEPLAYTPELGFKVLSNPRYQELTTKLEQFSLMHSNYRERVQEEVAEVVKSSAGSKSRTAKKA